MYDHVEKLVVWQEAHALVLYIYKVTNRLPKEELYGLTSQLRRSAASIPTNIVEGKARSTKKDYLRFLYIARGSLEETKYHVLLAKDLNYIEEEEFKLLVERMDKVGKLLGGLMKFLQRTVI